MNVEWRKPRECQGRGEAGEPRGKQIRGRIICIPGVGEGRPVFMPATWHGDTESNREIQHLARND